MASSTVSHPVIFSTSTQHALPPSKYLIPATWARFQLSQLVNKTLALPQPIPFDFLIRGQLLRGTIAEWCASNGVKEEETLEIEYFESLMPPKLLTSFGGEEWVGSVSCQLKGYILTGSYDSVIRVYDHSQQTLHTIGGHTGPVTSACWIPSTSSMEQSYSVLSGSHDGTARITSIPDLDTQSSAGALHATTSLRLHTSPVSSVAANSTGSHVLTAGWDGLLGIFTTEVPEKDEVLDDDDELAANRKKRRKVESNIPQAKRKAPLHVLKSHIGKVTRAIFDKSGEKVYSCSMDSTIRTWSVEMGVCTDTITANSRPMTDITVCSDEVTLLAASTDRVVAIYDLRQKSPSGPPSVLPHPSFPSAISAHPLASHKVATGAYDGFVRMWDLRSTKAPVNAFEVVGKKEEQVKSKGSKKVLSIDWANGILVAGGEAGVDLWRVTESGDTIAS